jgi:DNA-binding transcriptional LysR family regulator
MRNWDDLRIFLAVARSESLSGAAKTLRLDPATVGRRVARLEADIGAMLFVKSPQGYAITEAALRLMDAAEAAEASLLAGIGTATGAGAALSGTIRIGAPDGCANYLLPQVCARICDAHPGLDVQILALPRVVNLSRREADLAVAVSRPKTDRVHAERLTDYRLSLAASRDYLAHEGHPVDRGDLKGRRMIGYIPDMIYDAELDYLAALGITSVPLASNSVSVQLNWARAGAGLAIVHDFALPSAPELVRILPAEIQLQRTFWLLSHAGGPSDPRLARFTTLLGAGLRAEVAALEAQVDQAETTQAAAQPQGQQA